MSAWIKYKPVKFPKDELAHNAYIEWWYFNGHLESEQGQKFAFMSCFFKARPDKANLPIIKYLPSKLVYFYHSIVTDIDNKEFYPAIDHIVSVSDDSFGGPLLDIDFTKPSLSGTFPHFYLKEPRKFEYQLKSEILNLELLSDKRPLLEGGKGYVDVIGKKTYYYSLTSLETRGKITVGDREVKVKGKSWMDHQWANEAHSSDYWNWFSIQLNNGYEIVCYDYGNQSENSLLATIIDPRGKQTSYEKIEVVPLSKTYISHKTGAVYPLEWMIKIPSVNSEFKIEALVDNQEMNYFTINYWEGPTKVIANINGKEIQGVGYLELVGRPSIFSNISASFHELTGSESKI